MPTFTELAFAIHCIRIIVRESFMVMLSGKITF